MRTSLPKTRVFHLFFVIATFCILWGSSVSAQENILSSGGDGSGSGGTFSFSFGQFAYQTFFEGSGSIAQGVQHPFEISYVPSISSVLDTTIETGEISCFNALENLVVAGNGNRVTIQSNAVADFIAGKSILFLPGFQALSGSSAHGYITPNGNFCDGYLASSIVSLPPEVKASETSDPKVPNRGITPEMQVKVYPNPNKGSFKVDLTNFENSATITVYNVLGSIFYMSKSDQMTSNEITLPTIRKGIYFVKVTSNNKQFVKKIIVN
jgi:hypothetical protein